MHTTTYGEARQKLADLMRRAAENREPVQITRRNAENAVLLSLDEYKAMIDTLHLLSSPRNAERLLAAAARARAGELQEQVLIDPSGER